MASKYIMLDTCIISEAQKPRPRPELTEWLAELPSSTIAIPFSAIFETSHGIRLLADTDPEKAERLTKWQAELLSYEFHIPSTTARVAELLSAMACTGPLKYHWITCPDVPNTKKRKLKFGSDPMIAATAIAHQMPIATFNIRDFVLIDRYFPLPGVYDPMSSEWIIRPPNDWELPPNHVRRYPGMKVNDDDDHNRSTTANVIRLHSR